MFDNFINLQYSKAIIDTKWFNKWCYNLLTASRHSLILKNIHNNLEKEMNIEKFNKRIIIQKTVKL